MRKSKIQKCGIVMLSAMMLLPGKPAGAASADVVKKTIQYETNDSTEKRESDFPEKYEEDGVIYIRDTITYEVESETPVTKEETVTLKKKSDVIKQDESYEPEETVEKDGVTYTLAFTKEKTKILQKGYNYTVTGYSDYDNKSAADNASSKKEIQTKDPVTKQTVTVTCKKTGSVKKVADTWEDSYIDITFIAYDATHFSWNGIVIEKTVAEPLKGYHKELLASVGGSTADYKIQGITWNGKSYRNKNGVLCRKARASVKKRVSHYRVSYSGTRKVKAVKGTVYTSTYEGTIQKDTGEKTFRIAAEATYQAQKENHTVAVVLTVGVVLAVVAVVGILFIVRKKRSKKNGGKHYEQISK